MSRSSTFQLCSGNSTWIATYLLIKEDTYDVPIEFPGVAEKLREPPLLGMFLKMSLEGQYRALVLIDYYASAIAQGRARDE
jgi:hypothetical protein